MAKNTKHAAGGSKYLLETSMFPQEPVTLKEIRDITATHPWLFSGATMVTTPETGKFVAMLMKLIDEKKTIELGVFNGYSLLLTALTIPDNRKILAIDVDRQTYEMGLPVIKRTGG